MLLDALEPFGFEHVFPRGTLREPLAGLGRAQVVCLSRADAVSAAEREAIRQPRGRTRSASGLVRIGPRGQRTHQLRGETQPLESLAGRRVAAFCGIGNPAGFRHTLTGTGCEVVAWREFPDHHAYTPADLSALSDMTRNANAQAIVCTQKDLVKLRQDRTRRSAAVGRRH